jgi:hypothetical protein
MAPGWLRGCRGPQVRRNRRPFERKLRDVLFTFR